MLQTKFRFARSLRSAMLLCMLAVILFSCQKEGPVPLTASGATLQSNPNREAEYARIGGDLEAGFSYAVQDLMFKSLLVYLTQQKVDGDYEVLLSDLLAVPVQTGGTALDYFLSRSNESIARRDLRALMDDHPSTIVAVRGNPENWLNGTAIPTVKFVPTGFSETTKMTTGTRNGTSVALDLSTAFTEAVIVIMKSERHEDNGNLFVSQNANQFQRQAGPGVNASDVTGPIQLKTASDPEPTACPATLPTITSFTAVQENGGLKLSYAASDFPTTLCNWGRIRITRTNPDNSTVSWFRTADQPRFFTDPGGYPNVTYTYEINVYVAYVESSTGNWFTCPATNNLMTVSAQYPAFGSLVESLTGTNMSSSTIRYDWLPPENGVAEKYRLRRATVNGYVPLDPGNLEIDGLETDYFYNTIPVSLRGTLVETQIQYKSIGGWQGNFFDRTYASHRNAGEPLYFNGVRMNLLAFENTESALFGAPEIRLTALQATAAAATTTPVQTFIPMSGCTTPIQVIEWNWTPTFFFFFLLPPIPVLVTYDINTGFYYPSGSPGGYEILDAWNADLYSSAVTVTLKETDLNVPVITQTTNTQSIAVTPSASFGFKIGKGEASSVGISSTWSDATATIVRYPVDDIDIEVNKIIYYHEPRVLPKGRALFSNQSYQDQCKALGDNL